VLILNTYSHFSLSSKSWALGCLHFNVSGHGHVRKIRDFIEAQLKDERMVLCDMSFEPKKNFVSQQKLGQEKQKTSIL
jgi:hypothetical protein